MNPTTNWYWDRYHFPGRHARTRSRKVLVILWSLPSMYGYIYIHSPTLVDVLRLLVTNIPYMRDVAEQGTLFYLMLLSLYALYPKILFQVMDLFYLRSLEVTYIYIYIYNHWKGHVLKSHPKKITISELPNSFLNPDSQTFLFLPGEIFNFQSFRKRRSPVPSTGKCHPSSPTAFAFLLVAHYPAGRQRNEIHYPTAIGQWRAHSAAECEC